MTNALPHESMPPHDHHTQAPAVKSPSPATAKNTIAEPGRMGLRVLSVVAIGLLVLLSFGLLALERHDVLEKAKAQAQREVKRLAAELNQSLRLAQASIQVASASPALATADLMGDHHPLVQALSLPFELQRKGPATPGSTPLPASQWVPGLPQQAAGGWYLPLAWRQPPADGGQVYELQLSRDAILERFASEGLPAGGSMSLFRLEDDGATTILVRHPMVAGEQGLTVRGHVTEAVRRGPAGVFQATALVDGVHRIVGYQQLGDGAQRLVVVYALSVQSVLAGWTATLPWALALTLLVAAAMAYGAWRLDRSLGALQRNELRFRLAAAQGQVWEWDFGRGGTQPTDEFFTALGHPPPPRDRFVEGFFELVHADDRPRIRTALQRYLKGEADYRLDFRAQDAQGHYRWFETSGSGLRNASGKVTYMAGTVFDITDRKALEEAQRETLNRLATVANASSALFWTSDTDKRCDWVNQHWLNLLDSHLADELGDGWVRNIHPDDRASCMRTYELAFDARQPYTTEYRERRPNGEYRRLLEQGKPRYDADQRFIGYIGSCLDVTDLRQAEETARERGATLEQVFDVLQDMLFVVDAQERFIFFQAGKEDRLYRRPEDFLGRTIVEVMPPELATRFSAAMQRARHNGLQEMDYTLTLPGGEHYFNARLAWLPEAEHCMFVVRDTTAQQVATHERERLSAFILILVRLASRFINLPMHQMDEAIDQALHDMGTFVSADRAYLFDYDFVARTSSNSHEWCAEGIAPEKPNLQNLPLDWDPDWVATHQRGEMIHVPDVAAMPESPLKAVLQPQGIQSLMTLPLMSGDTCLGYVGLDSVRQLHQYDEEEITLLRLFAQMLVNLKLRAGAETKIHELTEQLEHKVEERTAQLEASVKRLQSVNRELETFTYSASHDLRTPLRGIEGFSALLLEEHGDKLDEQGREYLQRIQLATLHMSQLISDLLAYAHLEQMTEWIESVDLGKLVMEVSKPFSHTLEARQGQLLLGVPPGLQVMADPKGLSMALRNLMDNAIKFTPAARAPEIRIEAIEQPSTVLLRVRDRGLGFDMKHHDRIFGMFQRLHRQDQIPGTGIGLAMVHKAVERMGGRIWADSVPGEGTTFHIELPRG